MPANGQLPAKAHANDAWITPALAIAGVALIAVGVLCWVLNGRISKFEQVAVDSVIDDMGTCVKEATSKVGQQPGASPREQTGLSDFVVRSTTVAALSNLDLKTAKWNDQAQFNAGVYSPRADS